MQSRRPTLAIKSSARVQPAYDFSKSHSVRASSGPLWIHPGASDQNPLETQDAKQQEGAQPFAKGGGSSGTADAGRTNGHSLRSFAGVPHAQGTMDFSGAQAFMGTLKTLNAFVRCSDKGSLSQLVVNSSIVLAAARGNSVPPQGSSQCLQGGHRTHRVCGRNCPVIL